MAKLTYWVAMQTEDGDCYNILARTKKDCLAQMADRPDVEWEGPTKGEMVYKDAFDLFDWATGEGGGRRP